jgi:ribosomal protein S10
MNNQSLKIILHSSSKITLNLYITFLKTILDTFQEETLQYNVFSFPMKIKRITLLKSPHVFKKAKEHFEIREYKTVVFVKTSLHLDILKYFLINKPKSISLTLKY